MYTGSMSIESSNNDKNKFIIMQSVYNIQYINRPLISIVFFKGPFIDWLQPIHCIQSNIRPTTSQYILHLASVRSILYTMW